MAWDIKDIKKKLQLLEEKAINATSKQKLELLLDIDNYKDMINFYEGTKIYNLKEKFFPEVNNEHILESVDFFRRNGDQFASTIFEILSLPRLSWKAIFIKNPGYIEEFELVEKFLKEHNPRLLEMFNKYKAENRILISNNKYETTSCSGKCHYLVTEGESYISLRRNNQSYITHELAHAYLFQSKSDIKLIYNMVKSCLSEAYSIFIEFAYLDFLKQTKYKNYAINEEAKKLDSFICAVDYGIEDFKKISTINDYYKKLEMITLILSNLVAIYWLDLYKENKLDNRLLDFEKNIGIESLDNYFQKEDINVMVKSLSKHYKNYKKC